MKITAGREALNKKLQAVTGVLSGKAIMPILNEALIEISSTKDPDGNEIDAILITTSDNEVSASVMIPCTIEGDKRNFVCDISLIMETISTLKSEEIILTVEEKDVILSVPKTRKRFSIPIIHEAKSFPEIAAESYSDPIKINGGVVSKMIRKASLFVNPNDLRPNIAGINLFCKEGKFIVQAADGHIFCRTIIDSSKEEFPLPDMSDILIPKSIIKIISNYEGSNSMTLSLSGDGRVLKISDGVLTTRVILIAHKFPPVQPFFDEYQNNIYTKINREELLTSIKRISMFTNFNSKTIVFDMKGENLVIKGEDIDFRKKADELIEVSDKNEVMNFVSGFNGTFMKSIIQTLSGEDIYFTQLNSKKPGYFTDNSAEGFETIWIVAPMLVTPKAEATSTE